MSFCVLIFYFTAMNQLKKIKHNFYKDLEKVNTFEDLAILNSKYLGSRGAIREIFLSLKKFSVEEKSKIGKEANNLKIKLETEINKARNNFKIGPITENKDAGKTDILKTNFKIERGYLHIISKVLRNIGDIFNSIGFEILEGPEIESEYYNFDALNIPREHPARDMWDTFWLRQNEIKYQISNIKNTIKNSKSKTYKLTNLKTSKLLLRTHTSPMQIRYMEKHQPPFRIIVPGRCFRYEATDASHSIQFYQIEGLMVGKDINLANLKGILEEFFKRFFGSDIKIRIRPGYFPFVEPGIEIDIKESKKVKGKSKNSNWTEVAGAGMVHPNVFKNVGYNPKFCQGFAFGMGVDRLAMIKYGIDDIRLFYGGDLRFIRQF